VAKTNDPHAAAIKSWQTRARNAGGGGVVQQRTDWIDPERARSLLTDWAMNGGVGYLQRQRDPLTPSGREMTKALKTLPAYSGKMYRGCAMKKDELLRLKVGETFTVKKHSSASKDRSVAEDFIGSGRGRKPTLLIIHGRGRDLHSKKIGVFPEREVVLMAGTKLKITRLDRVVDPDGDEVFEIHAREVKG